MWCPHFLQFISVVWSFMWNLLSHQCLQSEGVTPPCHAGFGMSLSSAPQGRSGSSGPGCLLPGDITRQTCWWLLAPTVEVLGSSGCWKEKIMNLWSFFCDISGCMTLLSINSQLLVVFRSGVACSSDRISREMLHLWWLNSSWMIQAATAARWWTDWRTRALQFIWSSMVHNVHLHLHLHKAYFKFYLEIH